MTSRTLGLALSLALATGTALADPSPAKKALIDRIVALQQQGMAEGLANSIIQGPLAQLTQAGRAGLRGVFRQVHTVALVVQDFRQQVANAKFIVDHQNICHVYRSA